MKKLFALVALCVATVSASAQSEVGTFSLQPKIGFNVSFLTNAGKSSLPVYLGKPMEGSRDVKLGFVAGVEGEYQITPMISVAAGLLYSMQGTKWEDLESIYADDYRAMSKDRMVNLSYLNIPIVANFYVFKGFALKAGVQAGFLLDSKGKETVYDNDEKREVEGSYDIEGIKKFDLSIPLGASYEFNNVVIDARYNLGLTKVCPGEENKSSKNSVVQVTVGYKFAL
ncbi:MAG: porin family protein [Prevotella sp.]